MQKTVIHVIDSLNRGGAETVLAGTVPELPVRNIIVLLQNENEFGPIPNCERIIGLGFTGKFSVLACAYKLKRIIKEYNADVVHAHLYWSTIIARLACPANVKFFFTVHSLLSFDAFDHSKPSKYLEKLTYNASQSAIFVSNSAREDFDKHIGLKGPAHILYNYVSPEFFKEALPVEKQSKPLKLVAVGNLKAAKNYEYLIEVFKFLKKTDTEITLDIYGEGYLRGYLEEQIETHQLPVVLKGSNTNISAVLPLYDVFVMSSLHEGFGIAPLEAMAVGLPVILSDISVFQEVAASQALFFNPKNPADLAEKLVKIEKGDILLNPLSENGRTYAFEIAGKENYIKKLLSIYNI